MDLDDQLLKQAKAVAAASGKTLTKVVEDALRESLGRRQDHKKKRIVLPVDKGGVLLPGIDLDDSAALLEIMEGGGAST